MRVKAGGEIAHGVLVVELDAQPPARGKRHARRQAARLAHLVEFLGHDAGVSPDLVLPFLLVVDFLDDGHGDDHLVVLEGKEGPRVVKQHVRVQYECFYHGLRFLRFRGCLMPFPAHPSRQVEIPEVRAIVFLWGESKGAIVGPVGRVPWVDPIAG